MNKKLLIIGSGGHAKSIMNSVLKNKENEIIGFIDEYKKNKQEINGIKVIGKIKDIQKIIEKYTKCYFIVGIGDNFLRKKVFNQIIKSKIKNLKPISIIDKDSIISPLSKIGKGSFIAPGVIIQTHSKIGKCSIINTGTIIDHDNHIMNYASTAPGCVTGGSVTIGNLSHLALKVVVKNKISIGANTIIGSNSYVNKNCKSNSIYFGNPAEFFRVRSLEEKYL